MAMIDLPSDERAIIAQLLDDAAAAGYLVSVHDGEGFAVRISSDQTAIRLAIGDTDETMLLFRDPARVDQHGKPALVGFVSLVHGNGFSVIHDFSDNAETAGFLAPALALADRLAVVS